MMNNDWFMDYASHRVRLIALEQEWLEIRYWYLFDEQERRGWITKNGRHILIGEDSGSGGKSGEKVDKSGESGIIKEKSDKPITEIVDSAIERVPLVRISGYSDEQCATIQQQHRELLKFARDNNDSNEVAFVFNSFLQEKKLKLQTFVKKKVLNIFLLIPKSLIFRALKKIQRIAAIYVSTSFLKK